MTWRGFYEAAKRATVVMYLRDSRGNLIPFVSGVNISRDGSQASSVEVQI